MNSERIEITETSRGFHIYGEPVVCTYGSEIRVYESSAGDVPHVWLSVKCDGVSLHDQPEGEGAAHLNENQARSLIARLQAWVDEIPSRWESPNASASPPGDDEYGLARAAEQVADHMPPGWKP